MHIPVVVVPGFEADDIIGTLAKKAEMAGYKTYMVTPDKDFAQLVSENIFMYRPQFGGGYEVWGVDEVKKNFEVEHPLQVIDFLAMKGDAVDNIPGLPGIGDKTAKKLLSEYGSMENLLDHAHELKGKMRENVEASKELGLLSKRLATIILDVPVDFNEKNYELDTPDFGAVEAIFNELEFRRLLDNLKKTFQNEVIATPIEKKSPPSQSPAAGQGQFSLFDAPISITTETKATSFKRNNLDNTPHFYQLIQPGLALDLFVEKLMGQSSVCFDTETTGLDPITADLVGMAFSW